MSRYEIGSGRDGQLVVYDGNYQIAEVYDEEKVRTLLSKLEIAEKALEELTEADSNLRLVDVEKRATEALQQMRS